MRKGSGKKIGALLLVMCVLAGMAYSRMDASGAIFNESNAMRYGEYAASNTIEDSMLFIGTYLIHSQSLTDELYEKAQSSVEESNQSNVYYKSELADGNWFDITDGTGLSDISGEATVIPESDLEDLWVTSYTGLDGITKDVHGDTLNIFDDPDPYDLYNLPELEPIKLQYDNVFSTESEGVDKYYYIHLQEFFKKDLRNDVTDECDEQLDALQSCLEALNEADKKELGEIVSKLMGKVDARRRAEIFNQLANIDENELNLLQNICTGQGYKEEDFDDQQFVTNTNVIDAIGSSIQNCQESYTEHSGKMLEEGTTVLSEAEYEKSMRVIDLADGGVSQTLEGVLLELRDLYHVKDDTVVNKESELALLEGELLSKGEEKYLGMLTAGANGEYQAAVSNGASYAIKLQILDDQKSETNAAREEFQFLIQAKTNRQEAKAAVAYTYSRIDTAETFYPQIFGDEFLQKATESVDDHIIWLTDLAKSISGESEDLMSDMDALEAEKEQLLLDKAQALDNNDLAGAKKIDAQLALIDERIAEKEAELNDILEDATSTMAQKAEAANSAGDSSVLNNINRIKNDALANIADGNLDGLGNQIDALAALGAEGALNELKGKLEGSGADNSLLSDLEDAIKDSKDSSLHGALDGDGSDTETIQELIASLRDRSKDLISSNEGLSKAAKELTENIRDLSALGAEDALGDIKNTLGNADAGLLAKIDAAIADSKGSCFYENMEGHRTLLENVNRIKDGILEDISNGNINGNEAITEANFSLGILGGEDALKEIQEALEMAGSGNQATKDAVEDSKDGNYHSELNGLGDGTGLSGALFEQAVITFFGDAFNELTAQEKAIVTAVADRFGEEGSQACRNLASQYLKQCVDEENPYIYRKLQYEAGEYIPLQMIGKLCNYRYVYSDSRQEVTLTQKAKVYKFKLYSDEMSLRDQSVEKLTTKVKKQDIPYLAEADALHLFECQAEYIENTNFGVALNKRMENLATEFTILVKEGVQ